MLKKMLILVPLMLIIAAAAGLLFAYGSQNLSSKATDTPQEPATTASSEPSAVPSQSTTPVGVQTPAPSPAVQPSVEKNADQTLRITAVGDIMLGRGVAKRLSELKKNYLYPMEKVADQLKKGDIVFANLEAPITASTKSLTGLSQGGKWVLRSTPESFEAVRQGGFNLLSLSNNHILDFYEKGLLDTMDLLDRQKIAYAGAGRNLEQAKKPVILERKGLKIGLIAYTDMADIVYKGSPNLRFRAEEKRFGVSPLRYDFSTRPAKYDYKYMKEEIGKLRNQVDILMVSFHWGMEESFRVLPQQVEFAHFLIDNGADVILGHHPHQFQGIELYKGKPILYSMGNFIFDQNDPENQESFIVQMEFQAKKLAKLTALPVKTVDKAQVVPQTGKSAEEMLNRQLALSKALKTECKIAGDQLTYTLP
jgi:poly-gamma-glutamate capsule biosynthesis protein CapA/YwtB (metallophosphatase superfamily)